MAPLQAERQAYLLYSLYVEASTDNERDASGGARRLRVLCRDCPQTLFVWWAGLTLAAVARFVAVLLIAVSRLESTFLRA